MNPVTRFLKVSLFGVMLTACGTAYEIPTTGETATNRADAIFAEARNAPRRPLASVSEGQARFYRVAARIEPIARRFCQSEAPEIDCNVRLEIDQKMSVPNAYFTYLERDFRAPVIRFSVPMLQEASTDNEVAFILSHEYGHLIGQHIIKAQKQAVAGALLVGVLTAAAGGNVDPGTIDRNMELGAAIGGRAFSQTYELESDVLGARIATRAGYDAIEGAKFFARKGAETTSSGQLSFLGTHPPDAKRMAVVIATVDEINGN